MTLAPTLLRFLQHDGGRLLWFDDGDIAYDCDHPVPLSWVELMSPLASVHLVQLTEAILDYCTALECGDHASAPEFVDMLGPELGRVIRELLRRRGQRR